VREVVAEAVATGGVDVLVNCAGHGLIGALEELTDAEFRGVMETNLFGALAVTRAVLPHMRERGSGHIVQMSSMGGVSANPGHAVYATSKFALEGASEALAGEVAPFGIRVTIVEPGPFRTDFAGRSMLPSTPMAAYAGTPARAARDRFRDQDGVQPNDPAKGAAAIIAAVGAPTGPLRLPLGEEAVARIRGKLERQLADLEATMDLTLSTAYSW
jgi:NAD(P)-dependent dehydrogenase (short-subunit alcohol dehydrogenase family)